MTGNDALKHSHLPVVITTCYWVLVAPSLLPTFRHQRAPHISQQPYKALPRPAACRQWAHRAEPRTWGRTECRGLATDRGAFLWKGLLMPGIRHLHLTDYSLFSRWRTTEKEFACCQCAFLQRGTETVFYHFAHSLIVPCHKTGQDYNSRLDLKVIDLTAYQHQNRLYPLEIAYGDGAKGKSNLTHFCWVVTNAITNKN